MKTNTIFAALAALALLCACQGEPDKDVIAPELGVPTGVKLHSATETSLTFQWTAVEAASSYSWKLTLDGEVCKSGLEKKRNVAIDGLTPGTTYYFSVCANGEDASSDYCEPVEAKTKGAAPDPNVASKGICTDAPLVISFDSAPVLGLAGLIKVFRSDGAEVDRINLADISTVDILEDGTMVPKAKMMNSSTYTSFMDAINGGNRWRIVNYTPLRIKGNTLEIKHHQGVLEFGKEYYVTVDAGVVSGHEGIAAGEMTFSTKAQPASDTDIKVAADGSGDFCTIQGALAFANKNGATITVANGTYAECLYLRDKAGITIKGESRNGVRIAYPNNESYANGSGGGVSARPSAGSQVVSNGGRSLFLVEECDNLVLQDLTIENTFWVSDHKGQAETIYFNSQSNNHHLTIENCSLLSWQDTFLCKGIVWVHNSLIAGHVDYIWGYPKVCLFEDCEIRSRAGGYIVQARVPSGCKGFVFLNCSLTAEDGVSAGSMYLARSGGDPNYYDNVTYVNCTMSTVIASSGWYTNPAPNPATPTATTGWKEYGSKNPSGGAVTGHNSYGRVLTADEAASWLTREKILE